MAGAVASLLRPDVQAHLTALSILTLALVFVCISFCSDVIWGGPLGLLAQTHFELWLLHVPVIAIAWSWWGPQCWSSACPMLMDAETWSSKAISAPQPSLPQALALVHAGRCRSLAQRQSILLCPVCLQPWLWQVRCPGTWLQFCQYQKLSNDFYPYPRIMTSGCLWSTYPYSFADLMLKNRYLCWYIGIVNQSQNGSQLFAAFLPSV